MNAYCSIMGEGPGRADIVNAIRYERRWLAMGGAVHLHPNDPEAQAAAVASARARIKRLLEQGRALPKVAQTAGEKRYLGRAYDYAGGNGTGYIVKVEPETRSTFSITGGGLSADRWALTVANENGCQLLSENVAHHGLMRAARLPRITPEKCAALLSRATAANERNRRAADDERNAAAAREAQNRAAVAAAAPAGAVAMIIAEFMHDDSDSMTDYFASHATRAIVLGFSNHKRNLFPEFRKAAAMHPETADMANAPASCERRENYSMGAGTYLASSDRGRYAEINIRKVSLGNVPCRYLLEFPPKPEPAADVEPAPAAAADRGGRFTMSRHVHTKKGFDMWICGMAERVERAEYDALLERARALGGWYSRAWAGTPAGFAFKSEAKALAFMGADTPPPAPGGDDRPSSPAPAPAADRARAPRAGDGAAMAAKFRDMADALQKGIDDAFRDRATNTPKRAREAGNARNEGVQLQRAQRACLALAAAWEAGTVPPVLAKVTSRKAVCELTREKIDHSQGGYYTPGRLTGEPAQTSDQARALWAMLDGTPDAPDPRGADLELRAEIERLKLSRIPGYFATPGALVLRLLDWADIKPGMRVLEPSAGDGAIADALREEGADVLCIEMHNSLATVLERKGHNVRRGDFMNFSPPLDSPGDGPDFDRVVMNPPFEKGQDVRHVRHAFEFLKPGGRLVAIMSAGVTFRADCEPFRAWVDQLGGQIVELGAGAFKSSGTGVATVAVILDNDG